MRMKSIMDHAFSVIPDVKIQRSKFNRSHTLKTTFDAGYLIPILCDEALPGDDFNVRMTHFARLSTPLKPIMDNLYLDTFFFAVPIRLLWDNWQHFMGEKDDPDDTTEYLVPQVYYENGVNGGSLGDYFGLPLGCSGIRVSAFWHRAYALIYNEWFRPQDIIEKAHILKTDADEDPDDYPLLKRAKRHDYFTSCLPWPQKGDSVMLPLGENAPVTGIGALNASWPDSNTTVYETGGSTRIYSTSKIIDEDNASATRLVVEDDPTHTGYPGIYADLTEATASTINELRQAFQIQKMLERDARGGTRYIEIIRSHFGVISPDARLQRPEYLGGGSSVINVNPVASTNGASTGSIGTLGAFGTSSGQHGFQKSFTEHCVILGLANVRQDQIYQQGIDRMWSRQTKYDFYWPSLSSIGEQAVLRKEIYADGVEADDNTVFGYQERFAEYRYKNSVVTGKFKSGAAGTLHVWHLAQKFDAAPTLSQTFIEETPPMSRILATPTEPHILFDAFFDMYCVRPMPVYSVPGYIDHF